MSITEALTRREFTHGGLAAIMSTPAHSAAAERPEQGLDAQISINASATPVRFDRKIFGQFLEHFHRGLYGGIFQPGSPLADRTGFRLDVIEALRELRIPIVRWPGGCFVSAYHWQDGVGQPRTPAFNKPWGVEDPNTFGTDEFVAWCRMIGTEPYICTNAGTGTFEEMSDWVEYCNLTQGKFGRMRARNGHPQSFDVKYWSIGNENYFPTEIGSKTIDEWGMLVRESAKVMKAVDSKLMLLAAATVDSDWTAPLLKVAGNFLDYISIHGYWDFLWERGTRPASYIEAMMRSRQPEMQIEKAIKVVAENGFGGKIKIAFDEWNLRSWHHPGFPGGGADRIDLIRDRDENDLNHVYTMADALFSAAFLNGCLRHSDEVRMACMAPVVNVRGPLYAHDAGVVRRTTFHVLRMYSDLLQPNVVAIRVASAPLTSGDKSVPQVDAVVTRSDDRRRTTTALINRHPTRAARIRLEGMAARGGRLTILDGASPDDYNDVANPARVAPRRREVRLVGGIVEVPAHALAVLESEA